MAEISSEPQSNGRIKLDPLVAFQIIAWVVGALLTYGAVNARVSVVESQMQQMHDDMKDLKFDVKELLRRAQ